MKSKLFSRFNLNDDRNKGFSNDLRTFINLEQNTSEFIVSNLINYSSLRYTYERNQFSEKISKKLNVDLSLINNSFSVLDFLQKKIVDSNFDGDSIDLWIADLKELNIIDDTNIQKFTVSISKLWENAKEKYVEINRKQKYMSRIFPSIKSVDHTVELRGVFKDEYLINCDISCYDPAFIDVVPIISVNITLDSGLQKDVSFQGSPDDITNIINELSAALMESKQLTENIKIKK